MYLPKCVWFAGCLTIMTASLAAAQDVARRPASPGVERGYLIAGGGMSFGPKTSTTFSTEIGEKMGNFAQAYIAFAYFEDLMTDRARNDLVVVEQRLEAVTQRPWDFHGRDRGRAFTTGAKLTVPGLVRPYLAAGIGALNLKRIVTERTLGDVTDGFRVQAATGDDLINNAHPSTTRPIVEAGGGVSVIIKDAHVDVGYRYRRAFHAFEQTFDFSQVTVSAGVAF
jgi:hypothetical protein